MAVASAANDPGWFLRCTRSVALNEAEGCPPDPGGVEGTVGEAGVVNDVMTEASTPATSLASGAWPSVLAVIPQSRRRASGSPEVRAVSEAEPDRHRLAERLVQVEHPDRALSFDDWQVTDPILPRKEGGCGDR